MPRVPTYDGAVQETALQTPQTSAPDVSSGYRAIGAGLGQISEALDRIALRDDEAKANDVDSKMTLDYNKWEDANRGKFTNSAAKGYTDAVAAWWKDAASTYGAELSPRAKSLLNSTMKRRMDVAVAQAGKYEFAEGEKYADSTALNAMDNATRNALRTGDYAGESQRVRDLVAQMGARKNWDKDQRDAALAAQLGKFHTLVVSQLAEKDAESAKVYLEDAVKRGEVGDNQPRLEQIVKGEADNQFAKQFAAQQAGKPLGEQLQEASKIDDQQRREKTLLQVRNNYAMVEQAKRERQQAVTDEVWTKYVDKGRPVPEVLRGQMGETNLRELMRFEKERAQQASSGEKVKTDWVLYLETRSKLAAGENVDLRPLATRIAGPQLEQLVDIQTKRTAPGKTPEVATSEQQLSAAVSRLQIKDEDKGQFVSRAYEEFNEVLKRTGKEPSFDDRQKIIDKLTMDVVTDKGAIWDSKEKGYKLTPEQQAKTKFSAQPDGQTKAIRVKTPAEARALPKGTHFIDPNGVERIR